MDLAQGKYDGPNCLEEGADMTSQQVQDIMLKIDKKTGGQGGIRPHEMEKRVQEAYSFASQVLKTTAQLTDAYFLYTPSQIWLSAHWLADKPLTEFYLALKIPTTSSIYAKFMSTLQSCAALLSEHRTYPAPALTPQEISERDAKHKAELKRLIEKLKSCRDPEKVDLVKLNQAQKRDAVNEEGLEESKAKRRKVQREGFEKEAEEFWGPELKKP